MGNMNILGSGSGEASRGMAKSTSDEGRLTQVEN